MRYLNFLVLFVLTSNNAIALIEVDITRGNLNPLPIAVSPLSTDNKSNKSLKEILKKENIGSEISIVVENNLKTLGAMSSWKIKFVKKSPKAFL